MENRDNQQERHYEYAWLAGIIDGGGSITFQTILTKPANNLRITPFICIVNSDTKIINHCKAVLDRICRTRMIYKKSDSKENSFKNKKPCYQLRIDGFKSIILLLNKIKPYLIGKRKQADNLERFIKLRNKNLIKRDSNGRIKRITYTPEEIELLIQTKALNRNESSTTIRLSLQKAGKI